MKAAEKIEEALGIARQYGQIEGDHHRCWVIDQMVRVLLGDGYEAWIEAYQGGEDGPNTYEWDVGIAP